MYILSMLYIYIYIYIFFRQNFNFSVEWKFCRKRRAVPSCIFLVDDCLAYHSAFFRLHCGAVDERESLIYLS